MADGTRRTFGPVVLAGLAAAGLGALAGSRSWATFAVAGGESYQSALALGVSGWPEAPLVSALAYVVLAAWGVLLVTRGPFRRVVAVMAVAGSVGMLVAAAVAFVTTVHSVEDSFAGIGVSGDPSRTVWPFVAIVAALVSVAATTAAVRLVPSWPEMGGKYDAPGAAPPGHPEHGPDATPLDLWRAMDEGRDPTLPDERRTDP
jgi:uncharacterized membrane protein (TIGR02234 family)